MAYKCPVNRCNGEYVGWRGFIDSPTLVRQCSENPAHFYFIDEVTSKSLSEVILEREQRISTAIDQMRSQLSEEYPEARFEMYFLDKEELLSLYVKCKNCYRCLHF